MRKRKETTIVSVDVFADVQDNGDGTFTAMINTPDRLMSGPITRGNRQEALEEAASACSVNGGLGGGESIRRRGTWK